MKIMNEFVTYTPAENYAIIAINNGKANAISHEVVAGLNTALDTTLNRMK